MAARRGVPRRADARGVRDDRGEPPDGVEPAAAARARAAARSASRPAPRSASSTRRARRSPPGEAGEVVIRGPGRHARLPRQPRGERARRSSTAGSAPATGARFDDGYLVSSGRLKEMIIRGGENISPARGRGGAARAPGGRDAVVLRHRRRRSTASSSARRVVARAGEPTDGRRSIAHCRERLAAFKVPSVVHVVDAIPRTPTGKVQRPRIAGALRRGLMRFAVLGAGAIGAYVGAALARGGSDVVADRARRAARGAAGATASACSRRAATSRRSRRRPTTSTRSPTPTSSSSALKAYSLPGARAAARRRCSRPTRR